MIGWHVAELRPWCTTHGENSDGPQRERIDTIFQEAKACSCALRSMPVLGNYEQGWRVFLGMDAFKLVQNTECPSARQSRASNFAWYPFGMQQSFWRLESLTNEALLGGLADLVGSSRRVLARVLAHLAEVEERRLHLDLGHGSMFAYCVKRLGLSEDEACRRIEVARLARKHPGLYPRLASGRLSLSVAALLKPHLNESNANDLLELMAGSTVEQARAQLAARFPRPDVPSVIRKLPEPRSPSAQTCATVPLACISGSTGAPVGEPLFASHPDTAKIPDSLRAAPTRSCAPPVSTETSASPAVPQRIIEPLSKGRYKVQLTADTNLKEKLELARELMRHAQPDGDLASILSRALDLLIEKIMKQRFGARTTRSPAVHRTKGPEEGLAPRTSCASCVAARASESPDVSPSMATKSRIAGDNRLHVTPPVQHLTPEQTKQPSGPEERAASISAATVASTNDGEAPAASHLKSLNATIPRSTRRLVAERDGLRCSWLGPDGTRCNARAWLENDHACPRGRGGDASPGNIRLLCRAHNRRAAEIEYGRQHISDSIARARRERSAARRDARGGGPPMD